MHFALDLVLLAIDFRIARDWHFSFLVTRHLGVNLTSSGAMFYVGRRVFLAQPNMGSLNHQWHASNGIRSAWSHLHA